MSGYNTVNSASIPGFENLLGAGLSAGSSLTTTAIAANTQLWGQSQLQQGYPTYWTTSGTPAYSTPHPLTPETARDLMAQLEHDKVLVADHKLLFGQYMGKSLREIPLEYIVQLGAAMRGARIQVAKELRRRRALERLSK